MRPFVGARGYRPDVAGVAPVRVAAAVRAVAGPAGGRDRRRARRVLRRPARATLPARRAGTGANGPRLVLVDGLVRLTDRVEIEPVAGRLGEQEQQLVPARQPV